MPALSPPARLEPSIADVGDYLALLKPRVMSLVVFTALVGLVIAPGHVHPVIGFTALLCIAIGAGAAGALNMAYEADIDAIMTRTADRPIPQGRITPGEALGFGGLLAVFSVVTMGLMVNLAAGALLAFTIFFYAVVYTMWLKRWTPPHFWALSLLRSDDYARAGIPMLPVVSGERETRRQILIYSIVLAPIGAAPWLLGYAGLLYGASSVLGGALMIALSVRLYKAAKKPAIEQTAKQLFAFSILYLFVLFAVLLVEQGMDLPRLAW